MSEAEQESVSFELEHLIASAQDALTDDMVTRLSYNLTQTIDLLDRFNRSGIDRALPTIARLVENGDLDRLVAFASLFGSVEDSLSDDIVNRVALVATELAGIVDRIARNDGFQRLLDLLGREDVQGCLTDVLCASSAAKEEAAALPPSKGGFGAMWQLITDPATQDAMRYMVLLSKHMNKG